jgi:riboflavin transporter FmnP
MTILAAGIEMFITILLIRRYKKALNLFLIGICAGIAIIILNPDILNYLLETLGFKTSSSLTHIQAWSSGIKAFFAQPFGSGLGMTDQVAARFRLPVLTGDNLFLKYLVELGIAGFLLHIGLLLFILFGGLLMVRSHATPLWKRGVYATVISVTVGILVNGQTAVLYNSNFFSYIYWWLAGCSIAWIAILTTNIERQSEQSG